MTLAQPSVSEILPICVTLKQHWQPVNRQNTEMGILLSTTYHKAVRPTFTVSLIWKGDK